jgi:hypothetical protein
LICLFIIIIFNILFNFSEIHHQEARENFQSLATSSRFPSINPFPELRPWIKQEPGINQIYKLKPANGEYLESVGHSSQQHQQELPQPQTTSTPYEEFQKQQQLLVQQYQEQLKAQLLLQQQQFEQQQQQLLSSQHQQQRGSDEVLQSVGSLKPHEDLKIKTKPGVESTTATSSSSEALERKSGLEPMSLPTVSSRSSVHKSGLNATSEFSSNDSSLIVSINKTTVLSGLVREYIDSQRGILEIYQVGHSEVLTEPIAGNLNISKIQGWPSLIVVFY